MLLFLITRRLSLCVAPSNLKNNRWCLSLMVFLLKRMVTIVCLAAIRFYIISSNRHSRCKIARMLCLLYHCRLGISESLLPRAILDIQGSVHVILLLSLLLYHFSERNLYYRAWGHKIVLGCLISLEDFLLLFFITSPRLLVDARILMVVLMRRRRWHWKRCKVILGTSCEVLIIRGVGWVTPAEWRCHHWIVGSKVMIRIVNRGTACDWNSVLNHHGMWRDRERWEWCP